MITNTKLEFEYYSDGVSFRVKLMRNGIIESIHKVHLVVCNSYGQIILQLGNSNYKTFIRSALKPFQAIPFIATELRDKTIQDTRNLAIACSSHDGTPEQVKSVFKLLHQSGINSSLLQCPIPVGRTSPLDHNCSGKHASFLATCKYMNWDLETYLLQNHPLQKTIIEYVCKSLNISQQELILAYDDCGAPTLNLELFQMAYLYAQLNNFGKDNTKVLSQAIVKYPELVAGEGRFDTELMKKGQTQILSKGGAEGIQCMSHLNQGVGVAIKVEDGSRRAKQAAAIYVLQRLQWLEDKELETLKKQFLIINKNVRLIVNEA
uniref:Asparaginase n=1 Tax=Paulinella longichromatophora TaxID=1708747 RepID=A0A2H4ZQ87_9EUKA|nr:hypothetical protein PLO_724 [Paulinella longichromatophora]